MFPSGTMSNSTSMSEEASVSSDHTRGHDYNNSLSSLCTPISPPYRQQQQQEPPPKAKKTRSQPGNPDPDAEVIALSPKTLMATNRFVCEICNKGFQRDQNLQLHRRGHNLPWKLRQRSSKEGVRKRVYVCPEASCIHHHPSRALGDLTGIKKHYSRKHGEKKWKCDKCSKRYAVHSDWKAHVKTCGTREYRCDCGTLFSRKDSFITHRAFCDALAEESARLMAAADAAAATGMTTSISPPLIHHPLFLPFSSCDSLPNPKTNCNTNPCQVKPQNPLPSLLHPYLHHLPTTTSSYLSATTLLQRASTMGPTTTRSATISTAAAGQMGSSMFDAGDPSAWQRNDRLTRDFLGAVAGDTGEEGLLSLTGALGLDLVTAASCDRGDHNKHFVGFPPVTGTWGDR